MTKFLKSNLSVILVVMTGIFFRYWQISALPAGLFPDEAANGLDINEILEGRAQPFYERGNGREALFFYFLALSVAIFGRSPASHHIVSAGFGVATIIVTYFLVKRMFGRQVALLATFFMAVSSYMTTLNRTAFRANTAPFFGALTVLFLIKYFQSKNQKDKIIAAAATGVSFALGFYTYISFRMMVPLLIGMLAIAVFSKRDQIRKLTSEHFRPSLYSLAAFAVTIFPLAYYFYTHPGTFIGRAGQVSIFSPDLNRGDLWGTFLSVFYKTMLAFFTEGDLNFRHNVAASPFLSPLLSPFFAIGLLVFTGAGIVLLRQAWQKKIRPQTFYLTGVAAWFWLMLIPEVTTAEGIPHGLRLAGVIPAMFIIPAWTVGTLWEKLKPHLRHADISLAICAIFLSLLGAYNYYLYFGVAAHSPAYYYAFRSDLTVVSDYLNERDNKIKTFLSLDKFSEQTPQYLTTEFDQPYILLDPAKTYEVQLDPGDQVIFTQSTLFDRLKFREHHPDTKLVRQEVNKFGEIIMLVYEKP